MAYGAWQNLDWLLIKDVYDSEYSSYGYEIQVEAGYQIDEINRKLRYGVTRIRIVSKNGHYMISNNNTTAGIGTTTSDRVSVSGLDTVMKAPGDIIVQDLDDVTREITYNEDGSIPETLYVHGKYYVANTNAPGLPANAWYTLDITDRIPTIGPEGAKVYVKQNGEWKRGKLFIKKNGEWIKGKKLYIKQNGEWKQC